MKTVIWRYSTLASLVLQTLRWRGELPIKFLLITDCQYCQCCQHCQYSQCNQYCQVCGDPLVPGPRDHAQLDALQSDCRHLVSRWVQHKERRLINETALEEWFSARKRKIESSKHNPKWQKDGQTQLTTTWSSKKPKISQIFSWCIFFLPL